MQETESGATTLVVILISRKKKRESLEMFLPRISIMFDRLKVFLVIWKRIRTDSCTKRTQYCLDSYLEFFLR
jgi:hypothetical protein